jgi:outer membrane protein assembly factor BamB
MRRLTLVLCLGLLFAACFSDPVAEEFEPASPLTTLGATTTTEQTSTSTSSTTTTLPRREPGLVPEWTVGRPWGSVDGLVMFRGNPTRTYYGRGPVPQSPTVLWRFPDAPMCSNSPVGGQDKVWCGSGWTGQPAVWNRPDGITEVIFGAYDAKVHFVDAATGDRVRPDFAMGDIIKGSVSLDPDGFPLLYAGSRNPRYRIIALDREEPTEIWSLDAASVDGMWNNDWDSNAAIIDDVMYLGGENSWFFVVKLNRGYDDEGLVTVDPEVVFSMPAFTTELVNAVGRQQSVESSPTLFDDRVYFPNSAGRVVGLDISNVLEGEAPIVFDYWMGDDVDATIVIDEDGMLYVSAEVDLRTARAGEVGQLVKLDPYVDGDPRVWGISIPSTGGYEGGIWATPALVGPTLMVPTNTGRLLAVDTQTGDILWEDDIGGGAWSSPVVVDERMVVTTNCETQPTIRGYDVLNPSRPVALWDVPAEACIESTPAMWEGRFFVGSRDGYFYAFGDAP